MKGISYIIDEKNRKTAIVIDLKTFNKHEKEIEDLLEIIMAESRKDKESIAFEKVIKSLKKKGR